MFLKLHQKNKPILVSVDCIKLVYRAAKGTGSFIVTDIEEFNIDVDEPIDLLIERLTELQIEVDLFANDDG